MKTIIPPHKQRRAVIRVSICTFAWAFLTALETLAFPLTPSTLSYDASTSTPMPPTQTITFGSKSFIPQPWTSTGDRTWLSVSPSSGTIGREQDQVTVQVNATGLPAGTYNGNVIISIDGKRGKPQVTSVPVTLIVTGGTSAPTPSILFNPTSLSFSGTAGGTAPSAKSIMLTNPSGGTLNWNLTESAAWLGLNVTSGNTTTEIDSISASVLTSGLAAGTYSTAVTVSAPGATNSPQTIPVTLILSQPTVTTGSAVLTWSANTEPTLAGYKVYIGTAPGSYGPPVAVGLNTTYTVGGLTSGKTYYFSVTAIDENGVEGPHSSEVFKAL